MQWLADLIRSLFSIFPRLTIIAPDELGVRCTPGLRTGIRIRELTPGYWLYWPVFQLLEKCRVKVQIVDLRPQSVWSADRIELTISGAIRYHIRSARKALFENLDYDKNIQTVAFGIIQQYVRDHDMADLNTGLLEEDIVKGVRKEAEGWGLAIEKVYITDIGRTRNLRILTNEPLVIGGQI